jgi:CHAT domain-containing protein/tetratricopeptide (TPR) repeat protein
VVLAIVCVAGSGIAQREKPVPEQHAEIRQAAALNAEGYELFKQKRYSEAVRAIQRSLEIQERLLDPNDLDLATNLANLGGLLAELGNYDPAEKLYKRALTIKEGRLGRDDPDVALIVDRLGQLHYDKGEFGKALPLYQRALTISANASDHVATARGLNNMGELYKALGDYERAEALHRQALDIREKKLGKDHDHVTHSLERLAELRRARGDYAGAEPLYKSVLERREKRGTGDTRLAQAINDLGILYHEVGRYTEAVALLERGVEIDKRTMDPSDPARAIGLNNLAGAYLALGHYARAEPLLNEALKIKHQAYGPDHPSNAVTLSNLSVLYTGLGAIDKALEFEELAAEIDEKSLDSTLIYSADAHRRSYFGTIQGTTWGAVSLHVKSAPKLPRAARHALTTLLRRKGRVLDAGTNMLELLRSNADPADHAKLDRLRALRSELSNGALRGPLQGEGLEQHREQLGKLEEQARLVEESLAHRYAVLRLSQVPITVDSVQRLLGPQEALLEFAVYRPFRDGDLQKKGRWGEPHYVVYVLRNSGTPVFAELGPAQAIDALVHQFRAALANGTPDYSASARALDVRVMAPVRRLLGGVRDLVVAPDAALNLVPFGALVDENERLLITQFRFTYLTSGRDLLRRQISTPARSRPLIVADPDFGAIDAFGEPGPGDHRGFLLSHVSSLLFGPLPGTADEAKMLRGRFPDAVVLTKTKATEDAITSVHGPRILHIATHGFFLPDPAEQASAQPVSEAALTTDPLLRSGLALAGANRRRAGKSDGILTALEALSLDLQGTQLVVLSACETGVGHIRNSDGVYGLRRALVLAGAETQVMSLWKVPDHATYALMDEYYRRVLADGARSDALREAQLELLAKPATAHPVFWAGFIVSGDGRSLERHPPPSVRVVESTPSTKSTLRTSPGLRGCTCDTALGDRSTPWGLALLGVALRSWRRRGSARHQAV